MKTTRPITLLALLCLLVAGQAARASDGDSDLDTRFRAKLMKEKAKLNAEQTNPALKPRELGPVSDAECGSQNIGNVNTNGKPGSAPREIFVFAPNAINIVNTRACDN